MEEGASRGKMKVVIPSSYIISLQCHVRHSYVCEHNFDIEKIDTLHVQEAILKHMRRLLKGLDVSSIAIGRTSSMHVGWRRHVRHPTRLFDASTRISYATSIRTAYKALCMKNTKNQSRWTVMHYGGSKAFVHH